MALNKITITSLQEQQAFADVCARDQRNLGLVYLDGDLGAGKTTFVRFLAKALGSRDLVSSPTFSLQHIYNLPNGGSLEHWDLYRLRELPIDLLEPAPPGDFRVIEWATRFKEQLGTPTLHLYFEFADGQVGDQGRIVAIESLHPIDLIKL